MTDALIRFSVPGAAETEQYLRKIGFPIVRRSEPLNNGEVADLVAYCIDQNKDLYPEVAVMLSSDSSIETLTKLKNLAEALQANYALLVVNEQEYFWIKPDHSIFPVDPPANVNTTETHLVNKKDLTNKVFFIAENLPKSLSAYEQTYIMTAAFMLQCYLDKEGRYEELKDVLSAGSYLELMNELGMPPSLHDTVSSCVKRMGDERLQRFIKDTGEFPPGNVKMGDVLFEIIRSGILKTNVTAFTGKFLSDFTVQSIQEFFQEAIKMYSSEKEGKILVANGYYTYFTFDSAHASVMQIIYLGFLLHFLNTDMLRLQEASINKNNITEEVAWVARSVLQVSNIDHVAVETGDLLSLKEDEQCGMVMLVSHFSDVEKAEDHPHFEVSKIKKSGKIDRNHLLMEKSLALAKPGGIVWACVNNGLLSNQSAKPIRDVIISLAFVEAVINFPPSLLMLRKKKAGERSPENVFMGNLDTRENNNGIVDSFVLWKKGEYKQ